MKTHTGNDIFFRILIKTNPLYKCRTVSLPTRPVHSRNAQHFLLPPSQFLPHKVWLPHRRGKWRHSLLALSLACGVVNSPHDGGGLTGDSESFPYSRSCVGNRRHCWNSCICLQLCAFEEAGAKRFGFSECFWLDGMFAVCVQPGIGLR